MRSDSSISPWESEPDSPSEHVRERFGVVVQQQLGVDARFEAIDLDDEIVFDQRGVAIVERMRRARRRCA